MERWKVLTLTDGAVAGLLAIQRYRFLTIAQVARAAGHHWRVSLYRSSSSGERLFQTGPRKSACAASKVAKR